MTSAHRPHAAAAWSIRLLLACITAGCGDNAGLALDGGVDGSDPQPPIACDDHNPCTDDRAEAGACRFDPVEDGRPCDDGDLCTLGDRCRAGQCVAGARSSGPLAQIGSLEALSGGGMGAIGDRLLAVTGPSWSAHVRLVERQGANLVVAAGWDGRLEFLAGSDVLIQPVEGGLGAGLVVLGGRQDRSLAVFSVSPPAPAPASLAKRGDATLDGQIVSLAGHGARIWACTRDFFRGSEVAVVDVRDPDAPAVVGSVRMPTDCGAPRVRTRAGPGGAVRRIDRLRAQRVRCRPPRAPRRRRHRDVEQRRQRRSGVLARPHDHTAHGDRAGPPRRPAG